MNNDPFSREPITTELRVRYLAALIDCNQVAASNAVDQGLDADLEVPALLLDVLAAAQWEIGELWHRGEVTIAQEHWATENTKREIERVLLANPPVSRLGRSVLVSTAPGEIHALPARIVAAVFQWRGWKVDFLGHAPPIEDFVRHVVEYEPDLVALSLTLTPSRVTARRLSAALSELDSPPPILMGGSGTRGLEPIDLGADAFASGALDGLDQANQLVGVGRQRDPEAYLNLVGRRIQKLRSGLGISQAELAERCALTRPYLSAVERGRQNITLEASLRIAGALEVAMTDLLDEES